MYHHFYDWIRNIVLCWGRRKRFLFTLSSTVMFLWKAVLEISINKCRILHIFWTVSHQNTWDCLWRHKFFKISKNIFWPANRVWNNLLRNENDKFWHVKLTGYFYVLYLRAIVVSGFRSLERKLRPSLVSYHFYSQQLRR